MIDDWTDEEVEDLLEYLRQDGFVQHSEDGSWTLTDKARRETPRHKPRIQ